MIQTNAVGPKGYADRLGLAISLGLSPYEARAYLVLLERGESNASQVASALAHLEVSGRFFAGDEDAIRPDT